MLVEDTRTLGQKRKKVLSLLTTTVVRGSGFLWFCKPNFQEEKRTM